MLRRRESSDNYELVNIKRACHIKLVSGILQKYKLFQNMFPLTFNNYVAFSWILVFVKICF